MNFNRFKSVTGIATQVTVAALIGVAPCQYGHAQSYPSSPIKLIVGYSAGGATDAVARLVATTLEHELGQSVVVDNKPGSGTIVATSALMRAKPDGYTLMLHAPDISAVPALKKTAPWNVAADFTPVVLVARSSLIYVVNADVPAKTLQEFVAYAKSKPGALNYGSAGTGSILHLGAIQLESENGLSMQHIPYNGGGTLMQALMGGQVDLAVLTPINAPASARLRPLAQTGNTRHPLLPNVPTATEAGFQSLNQAVTFTLVGPRSLPAEVIARLQASLRKASSTPAYRSAMVAAGAEAAYQDGPELAKSLIDTFQLTQRFVKIANIPLTD